MELEPVAIHTQVERLLKSKTLEGSEVHRKLLAYLADKAIAGESDRLKEYTVALEALGKPSSYDPRHDSVVRIQLGRLRQKLSQYYLTEGVEDPIVVSLPKGGFQLHFAPPQSNGNSSVHAPTPRWKLYALLLAAGAVVLGVWAVAATVSLARLRQETRPLTEQWTPELAELWAPLMNREHPLLLCLGTPLFTRIPGFGFFRDPAANQWEDLQASSHFKAIEKSGSAAAMPWFTFTGTGEAQAAFLLARLLATRRPDLLLTRSNILSWQQVNDNDLIFIGPPKFNNQLDALPASREIVVEPHGIRNRHPRSGEPEFLEDKFQAGVQFDGETHALISLMPGLSGSGDLLILAGNASADTYAAAQWLTQPSLAKQLTQRLRLSSGKLPRYYQVVLNVKFRNGIPVQSSYVYHRVIQ